MNPKALSLAQRALLRIWQDDRGQILPVMLIFATVLFAMIGFTADVGNAYWSYHELQSSSDAAALAGAWALPNSTAAATAIAYSSVSGGKNVYANLGTVTMSPGFPLVRCLTTLKAQGEACLAPAGGNAITVKQQAVVPMWFAKFVGYNSITISTSSTAAMRGSKPKPYNVAIVLDTTASMATSDSDCGGASRLNCALQGVQVMLQDLSPCAASMSTCTFSSGGVATNAVDQVAIFTFPNVTVGTAANAYNCTGTSPTIPIYSFPAATATTYAPTGSTTATYQVTPFLSNYRNSDTSSSLNTSSYLSTATGAKSGCPGMQDPGGDGTFYAGVIYAAQAALTAQAAADNNPNIMIILSDGDATADSSKMATKTADNVSLNSGGTYPSYVDECGQAILAAKAATAAGTHVYTVAYGSGDSGCATDTTNAAGYKGVTPCQTMQDMASAPQYFFSDYNQSGSGSTCQSASQPTTNINQIFGQIANDLTVARLIPDSTP
jgi:Flp pilus assembly protein TadG